MSDVQKSLGLTTGGTSVRRRELDFYPTPWDVTAALMEFLSLPKTVVWEPAAGDGAMVDVIRSYGHEVVATDLSTGTDYLTAPSVGAGAVVTNPPFKSAESFIRKVVGESPVVAMLLKCQYWHAAGRLSLFRRYAPAYVLPLTWRPDFMAGERGGSPTMDVQWTVWWRNRGTRTVYSPLPRPTKS